MRVIIVDDEELARMVVREFLRKQPDIDILAECANGFEAVKAITELEPDLVFLDIQMPKLDGFEVAELAGNRTRYIFVTAYDQYALKAFDIHAIDYLLKPFSEQRFQAALQQARERIAPVNVQALAQEANAHKSLERIVIRDGSRVHVIPAERISYIEAQDDYVQIRSEGKDYLKNQRLSELETQLDPARFVRVHRSYILNLEAMERIEQYAKDSHQAILKDGAKLPISRSGYQKLRAIIQ
ncbi:LytTR family DNA-binding domain-containing protein [Massilia sp. TS11]|uniref:LytR/AlgR family response regulator transcription factor n=1 Tax=Massilia sp. TS11 TaxID=2908003 RepID=UPI001EDA0582|nr:LytTR family DNA-binding domain-containing protein [Massilia sp. TS11]MCG2584212.1 LytTR family DNA-binding domain-containing protein [Massilia sp. TS11]